MVDPVFLHVLRKIIAGLEKSDVIWAVGGSLSLALRGAPVQPRDIDMLTDRPGSYKIERIFLRFVVDKVSLRNSENIRSHFGELDMDGVKIEIMGDFQLRSENGDWDDPPDLQNIRQVVQFGDLHVPVLTLDWEHRAYSRLGRHEKVSMISQLMRSSKPGEP